MSHLSCNHLKGDPDPAECPNCGDGFYRVIDSAAEPENKPSTASS